MNKTMVIEVSPILEGTKNVKEIFDAQDYTVTFRTKREGFPNQIITVCSSRRGDGIEIYTQNGRLVIEPQASNHIYLTQSKKF